MSSIASDRLARACRDLETTGRKLDAVVRALPDPPRAATGPLLGLPVAVKDMIDVAGVVRGCGNPRAMSGPPAAGDAAVIARLRAAAADVFATAAMLEYAAGAQHPDLPEARNPADPSRTAGGSSGGSAALVASGVCPAALGTDTGGSIRIPASYCGCVGLKPSYGLVPVDGVQGLAPSLDHVGVLAADVDTAMRVMSVIGGLSSLRAAEPEQLRLGVLRAEVGDERLQPDVRAVTEAALGRLAEAGVTLIDVDVRALRALHALFDPIILFEAWRELGPLAADPSWFGPDTDRLLRLGSTVTEADYRTALDRRNELLPAAEALLSGVDALFGPAVPFVAPDTTPVLDSPLGEIEGLFSMAANLTGQPAIVLPAGQDRDGMPIGVQLAGRRGQDAELLAVAAAIESVLRPDVS